MSNYQENLIDANGAIKLTTSTVFVTGTTSTGKFLIADINGRNVGIPLYKFSYSDPEIDLITPYTDFVLDKAVLVDTANAYNAAIVVNFYTSANPCASAAYNYAIPIYKLGNNIESVPTIQFKDPTIATNLTSTGKYLVASIDNDAWGIPLYDYDSLYPFTTTVTQSAVSATTIIEVNPTQYDASSRDAGSTNLNSKIKTYADLIKRIKMHLGWPIVQLELCDEQIVEHIDTALEWYTKYAGYTEELLAFDSANYICGYGLPVDKIFSQLYCMSQCEPRMSNKKAEETPVQSQFKDYDLDSYRKVVDVWSFDEADGQTSDYLFSLEYVFAQQTYFSYVLGNYGFDLVTWHILKDWIDTREKVFALKRRVYFDDRKQVLKLIPEPRGDNPRKAERFVGILGCYVEKPIKELISERWIYQYTLALSKITIGNIRGKFTSVTMFGGGSINYNDLLSQGLEEKKTLEAELLEKHGEVAPIKFFVG